jgi:beta-lactamase class A
MNYLRRFAAALPVLALLALPKVALADNLDSWRLSAMQSQLELTTDESVQPVVQFVPSPDRIVIDLPGIRWTRPKINQTYAGAVRSVRIARFEATTTRIVLDLAPGSTVDPQQVKVVAKSDRQWSIQLPALQSARGGIVGGMPVAIAVPTAPQLPRPSLGAGLPSNGRALTWLQQRLASLQQGRNLKPGAFVLDLDTGDYANVNGDKVFPTASIIKLPILIAFLQDVETGKISLKETLTMGGDVVVGGSGYMQDLPVGSKFSALEVINNMIITSDNTATNMVIKRMGGVAVLNQRFRDWGLDKTRIRNWLPDLSGTNTTTAQELVKVMGMLEQGSLLNAQKPLAIDIMTRVKNRKLLVQGLGRGATIAHKTGDIGFLLGDSGIVYMPSGKRYLISVLVESEYDDADAMTYIQQLSGVVYRYLDGSRTIGQMP